MAQCFFIFIHLSSNYLYVPTLICLGNLIITILTFLQEYECLLFSYYGTIIDYGESKSYYLHNRSLEWKLSFNQIYLIITVSLSKYAGLRFIVYSLNKPHSFPMKGFKRRSLLSYYLYIYILYLYLYCARMLEGCRIWVRWGKVVRFVSESLPRLMAATPYPRRLSS